MSNIEQLDIETESVDCRSFNNRPTGAHAEGFESTLRIPEGQAGRQTDSEIEDAAALFATPGLVNTNQARVNCSRSKCQVALTAFDWINQFRRFCNWRREIGIGK
jgi:hypothetical protein